MTAHELHGVDVAVVGGGPAGLRAAEVASAFGLRVALLESNPFVGRKFLVAGKGGLNLTHGEPLPKFVSRYRSGLPLPPGATNPVPELWASLIQEFGPGALREWAAGLGVETFEAGTGRVYPKAMRAAPLLRAWMNRLQASGVILHLRHALQDIHSREGLTLVCSAPGGVQKTISARAVVLALGGASWPRTGSNAHWVALVEKLGIPVSPLEPANCGWECEWPAEVRTECEGKPLKNVRVSTGGHSVRGELLVTRYGLEGGALYALSHVLRGQSSPELSIDFKPDSLPESLMRRLGSAQKNFLAEACTRWRLDATAAALLHHTFSSTAITSAEDAVRAVKNFPVPLSAPRPIAEAISTAGGVCLDAVDCSLMSRKVPGLFFAGEMLDWEAPTGGYLLQGCFATGTRAGRSAAHWALHGTPVP